MRNFYIDGTSSAAYNIFASGENVYNAAERDVESVYVPGRNGNLLIDNGTFKNIDTKYPCVMPYGFTGNVQSIRNWLMSSSYAYHKITDDYDTTHFRVGRYKGGIEFAPMYANQAAATFDLTFDCKPQRFLNSGTLPISVENGDELENPTAFDAKPIIRLSGSGYFRLNGKEIALYGDKNHDALIERFLAAMNDKAAEIGMGNSVFNSPSGLPRISSREIFSTSRNDRVTAKDVIKLLAYTRQNEFVYEALGTESETILIDGNRYTAYHTTLNSTSWKSWEEESGYTLLAAKGGYLAAAYGENGSNGILNYAMFVSDGEKEYAIAILGLKNTDEDHETARTLTSDLIQLFNGGAESQNIRDAASRTFPVCMGISEITGVYADDVAAIESGVYYNENEQKVSASVAKILMALIVNENAEQREISISELDCVGGSHGNHIGFGATLPMGDAITEALLISDNITATALARDCFDDRTSFVEVDCEINECTSDGENANDLVLIDDGIVLHGGNNSVDYTGGITSAQIIPRWWEL